MNYGFDKFSRVKRLSLKWVNDLLKLIIPTKRLDWESYIQKTYILHLPEEKIRKRNLNKELSKIKTKYGNLKNKVTWWEGLKGITKWDESLYIGEYSFYHHYLIDPVDTYGMTKEQMKSTMIKCTIPEHSIALSHIKILQDIVKNDIPCALIMEDDVWVRYDFSKRFKSIMDKQIPKDFDILYISSLPVKKGFTWDDYSKDIIRVYNGVWWMSGLVVTKKAAQKILDNLPCVGPIDLWINHQFGGLNVYMTKENLVEQRLDYKSLNSYSFPKSYPERV